MSSTVLVFSDNLPDDQKARLAERYTLADFSGYHDPSTAPGFDDALARARGAIGVSMRWPAETIERALCAVFGAPKNIPSVPRRR